MTTRRGARSLPAVSRCTSIIVDTIAGLPWNVRRGWELLERPAWIEDPQALRQDGRIVGASVDEVRLSAVEFWAQWLVGALWFGDGYVYVPVRDTAGQRRSRRCGCCTRMMWRSGAGRTGLG